VGVAHGSHEDRLDRHSCPFSPRLRNAALFSKLAGGGYCDSLPRGTPAEPLGDFGWETVIGSRLKKARIDAFWNQIGTKDEMLDYQGFCLVRKLLILLEPAPGFEPGTY
jgi:hypothetical protein